MTSANQKPILGNRVFIRIFLTYAMVKETLKIVSFVEVGKLKVFIAQIYIYTTGKKKVHKKQHSGKTTTKQTCACHIYR
jgi:hypothetical protein